MPPIARALGLIFVVASPACLAAQTSFPYDPPFRGTGMPPAGYSGAPEEGAGLATDRSTTDVLRGAHPDLPLDGAGIERTNGTPLWQPESPRDEVLPAAFHSPVPAGDDPAPSGEPAPSRGNSSETGPIPLRGREAPLPLALPGRGAREDGKRIGNLPSLITVAGSLAVVLGIFFLVAWAMRRAAPPGLLTLPGDVFEVLGRAPMASHRGGSHRVHLLRCGRKLLLVSVGPAGTETLTEITDPVEVDRLAGLCQQARPNSATAAFRQVFGQFAPRGLRSGSLTGLLGENDCHDARMAGTGSLATNDGLEDRDV